MVRVPNSKTRRKPGKGNLEAVRQDFAPSLYNLGVMYHSGQGDLDVNFEKASDYYLQAIQALSQQSYHKPKKWFLRAAEKGCAEACANIELKYENGKVIPRTTR